MPAKTGSKTKSKGGLGRGISNLINVDDENEKNANQAIVWDKWNNPIGYDLPADKNFHGITPGRNTKYELLQF